MTMCLHCGEESCEAGFECLQNPQRPDLLSKHAERTREFLREALHVPRREYLVRQ